MKTFCCLLLVCAAVVLAFGQPAASLEPVATEPDPNRAASPTVEVPRGKRIVAIDVGHTQASPGATSATGIPEYEFNLRIAERVRAALAQTPEIEPFVISSTKAMSLPARTRLAASRNAELFVSIHHDAVQDKYLQEWEVNGKRQKYADQFSGYGLFVSRKNPYYAESLIVARNIGNAMAANGFKFTTHHNEPVKGENRPIIDQEAGVYAFDDLVVLKTASMPAVLVECGVILNREEERALLTPERQARITAAITRGVADYLRRTPSPLRAARNIPAVESPSAAPAALKAETSSQPQSNRQPSPGKYPKPGTPLEPGAVRSTDRP